MTDSLSTLPTVKKIRRRYSREFKQQVLTACEDPNTSIAQVARDYGINANQIQNWKRQLKKRHASQAAFIPLVLNDLPPSSPQTLLVELPAPQGKIAVHWPVTELAKLSAFVKSVQS
ncbi:hypothetical protein THMIRHAS_20130 [Thiosulfatimonas sediminis]|uniref:Transposase n=1 Tax=Thiosulfatimonas sediminis TaxID=2675054 RepID=A0A6F8PXE5_9GAMM|nr:transposase [Thiosulfatimonas sediminis]BBP46640.1 hypothetical protein THMIRHAS_20130 [Thiosulfatimonas sediminis]